MQRNGRAWSTAYRWFQHRVILEAFDGGFYALILAAIVVVVSCTTMESILCARNAQAIGTIRKHGKIEGSAFTKSTLILLITTRRT